MTFQLAQSNCILVIPVVSMPGSFNDDERY